MKRILFVEAEERALRELERALSPLADRWQMTFLAGEEEATSLVENGRVDVLVGDAGDAGRISLDLAHRRDSSIVRLALAPEAREAPPAVPVHQVVPQPCSQTVLATSIARACALHSLFVDPRLTRLIGRLELLPELEPLRDAAASEGGSPPDALRAAWLEAIGPLEARLPGGSARERRRAHASEVARCAALILAAERCDARARDEGWLAGLVHDLGELVLAANLPERFRAVAELAERDAGERTSLETRAFGASHAALGAWLLGRAGHSTAVVEAVAFHHRPSQWSDTLFGPLAAVHAANCLAELAESPSAADVPGLDRVFLRRIGLQGRVAAWAELCRPASAD